MLISRFASQIVLGTLTTALCVGTAQAQQQSYDLADDDIWVLAETPDPGTPAGQLAIAQRQLAEGNYQRAESLADSWIELHENHPMLPVAYLVRGDAQTARGQEYRALFDYEFIARGYPGSEVFVTALQRELDIARMYAHGKRRRLWGLLRIVKAEDEAEELLIRVQERMPGSTIAEQAGMELGDFYMRRGEMRLAADSYDLFIENYPNSEHLNKARQRLIAAQLASSKGYEFDATGLVDARQRILEMKAITPAAAEQFGADALLADIDESMAKKMLTTARWYLKTGDALSAEFTIRRLIQKYPQTLATLDALRLIPDILPWLADNVRAKVTPFYTARREALLNTETESTTEQESKSSTEADTQPESDGNEGGQP